jgi:hypothetical protein
MKYLDRGFAHIVMKRIPLPAPIAESVIQTMSNDIAKSLKTSCAMIAIAKKKGSWRENKENKKKLYFLL